MVVVPARNVDAAAETLAGLDVEIRAMDLMVPKTIDVFAARFLVAGRPLHLLVNNAGIGRAVGSRRTRLRVGLRDEPRRPLPPHLPAVDRAACREGARRCRLVVGPSASPVVLDDLMFERRDYDPVLSYGQSKTANILHAVALDEPGRDEHIRAFSLHPGTIVDSNFKRYTPPEVLTAFGLVDENGDAVIDPSKSRKTVEQGAATSVWCATSPKARRPRWPVCTGL